MNITDETASTATSDSDPRRHNARPHRVSSLVKVSVFVGIFLLRILDGIPWVWGNLNVYVTSYYYDKGDNSSGSSTNWLLSIDSCGFNFGLFFGGLISRKIGIRLTLFFALLGFNSGLACTYFSIQNSAATLIITFGALTGICGGIIENCQLTLMVRWTNYYKGLAASSVSSMNILGAVIMNYILTMFINPYNYKTDAVRDDVAIFTQPDLTRRVPYAFVLHGFLSFCVNTVGFFLIRINREDSCFANELVTGIKNIFCSRRDPEETVQFKYESPSARYESLYKDEDARSLPQEDGAQITSETMSTTTNCSNLELDADFHLTPRQALKTKTFYVLCIFASCLTYGFFVLNTYYKQFGLLHITDDHFLTVVGMVKCLATPVCTWIAGFCVDRFGTKPTMVFVSSFYCIISSFYYSTTIDRWFYMFSTVLYGCSLFSLFCLTSVCCVKLYGQSHFSTIFGLIQSISNIPIFAVPPIARWIVSAHGWVVLFISVGVLSFCQVIVLVVGLPETQLFKKAGEKDENDEQ